MRKQAFMISDLLNNEINAQKKVYVREITEVPLPTSLRSRMSKTSTLSDEVKNRIQAFVAAHLFPFISGMEMERIYVDVEKKIAAEALQNDRLTIGADELKAHKEKMIEEAKKAARSAKASMMEALLKHLHKKNLKLSKRDDGKIQKFALQEYLKRAVIGLYKHLEVGNKVLIEPTEKEPLGIIEKALEPALRYDFPSEKFSEKTLKKWIAIAFDEVNRKKCERKLRTIRSFFKDGKRPNGS